MSEKTKKVLDKINRCLGILLVVVAIVAACRIVNVYHDVYNDNSSNEYSVIKVTPNNTEKIVE